MSEHAKIKPSHLSRIAIVYEALSLPEGHQCFGAMMVGCPGFGYHRLPLRKTPDITWR